MYSFHVSLIFFSSTITLPDTSFRQYEPVISCLSTVLSELNILLYIVESFKLMLLNASLCLWTCSSIQMVVIVIAIIMHLLCVFNLLHLCNYVSKCLLTSGCGWLYMFVIMLYIITDVNELNAVDIRLRWSCESSNDLLPQQPAPNTFHDSGVLQCCLQVGCSDGHNVKTV